MPRAPRVTVVGSINMDLVATARRLPAPGETVLGTSFRTSPGGKGANQAIAAARAGGDVAFVGAVGADPFADVLSDTLSSAGVATGALRRVDGPSGVAVITVDVAGENSIIVIPGANGAVTELTDADRALIAAARILVLQLEIPIGTVGVAARVARDSGVPVLLNPSPVQALPAELLDCVTLLVVNEGEASALGAAALAAVPHLVTTLGARGARYRGPSAATTGVTEEPGRAPTVTVPAPVVRAVDTTGAGDAFTGALAVAWAEGLDPAAALRRACAAGALATTVVGASASSPRREAIDELVAAGDGAGASR